VKIDLFRKAISIAHSGVKPGKLPILGTMLIEADDGTLTATGTDLDHTIKISVQCDTGFEFAGCVDASHISRIASGLLGDDVLMRENKGDLVVVCNKALFRLSAQPANNFPQIEDDIDGASFMVGRDFFDAIKRVSPAAGRDDIRFYINGIHINGDGDTTIIEATNGHVCARSTVKCGFVGDVILPNPALKLMEKMPLSDQVSISTKPGYIKFNGGSIAIISKLIDGKFPETTKLFSHPGYADIRINRAELAKAVDLASIQNGKKDGVSISVEKQNVVVVGKGSFIDVATSYDQGGKLFGMNPDYLSSVLETCMTGKDVSIHIKDGTSPIVISDDVGNLATIMPMRL